MPIHNQETLRIRTGELNTEDEGREIFNMFRFNTKTQEYIKIKISFVSYNATNDQYYWLYADTLIDKDAVANMIEVLESWRIGASTWKTGLSKNEQIDIKDDRIDSLNLEAKMFRILIPAWKNQTKKMAITKITRDNVKAISHYLRRFLTNSAGPIEDTPENKMEKNLRKEIAVLREENDRLSLRLAEKIKGNDTSLFSTKFEGPSNTGRGFRVEPVKGWEPPVNEDKAAVDQDIGELLEGFGN